MFLKIIEFIFFPKTCAFCHRFGSLICTRCFGEIPKIHLQKKNCGKYIDDRISFYHYSTNVKFVIKHAKYYGHYELLKSFLELMDISLVKIFLNVSLNNVYIIPVPLHPARLRERGFNQAEIITKYIGRKLSIPVRIDILRRIQNTAHQARILNIAHREENLRGAFECNSNIVADKNHAVLLVDDVWTTGSTLNSAGKALKEYGFKKVYALTIAT